MHGFLRCHLDPELRAGEVLARKFLEVRSLTHLPSTSDSSSAAAREGVPPVQRWRSTLRSGISEVPREELDSTCVALEISSNTLYLEVLK